MSKNLGNFTPKYVPKYFCDNCDFKCCNKKDYNRHLLTAKHKKNENTTNTTDFTPILPHCICGRKYKYRASLYNHKKKCTYVQESDLSCQIIESDNNRLSVTTDTIMSLVSENNDIKNLLLEQQKQIAEQQRQLGELIPKMGTNITNNTTNNANIKQKFNINIFLNEQCKDAINMGEFIRQIQMTLDNLDLTKNKGLMEGISNIFIENMNKLSLYERPLHCTDTKRETLYIKDNNNWEKDKDRTKIKSAIKNISKSHYKLIQEWINENPDFKEVDAKQDYFVHLLRTCGANLEGINDKVIKKICTSSYLKGDLRDYLETNLLE